MRKRLFHGLVGAVVTGLANAALTKLGDASFDITRDWKAFLSSVVVGALVGAFTWLKQSPLPYYDFEGGTVPSPKPETENPQP